MLSILTTTASVPSKATHPHLRHSAEALKAVSNPIQLNILDRLLCLKLVVTRSHHIGIKARDSDLESAFKEHLSGVMDLPVRSIPPVVSPIRWR